MFLRSYGLIYKAPWEILTKSLFFSLILSNSKNVNQEKKYFDKSEIVDKKRPNCWQNIAIRKKSKLFEHLRWQIDKMLTLLQKKVSNLSFYMFKKTLSGIKFS